jgi:hypothetical protein
LFDIFDENREKEDKKQFEGNAREARLQGTWASTHPHVVGGSSSLGPLVEVIGRT